VKFFWSCSESLADPRRINDQHCTFQWQEETEIFSSAQTRYHIGHLVQATGYSIQQRNNATIESYATRDTCWLGSVSFLSEGMRKCPKSTTEHTLRASEFVPTSSLILFPSLKTMNVGICNKAVNTNRPRKGRAWTHGMDVELLWDLYLFIHVDLVKTDRFKSGIVRELVKDRGDDSARTTPRSPEVNNDDFARVGL